MNCCPGSSLPVSSNAISRNGFNVDPGASRRRLARSIPCAARIVRDVTSTTTKAPGNFPIALSTSRCSFDGVAESSEYSGKARSMARKNAIAISGRFRRVGCTGLNSNACRVLGEAWLPQQLASCRRWDSVYHLGHTLRQEVPQGRSCRGQTGNPVY